MVRSAQVTIAVQGWTGWSVEQPQAKSVQLTVHRGQLLTPETVGIESAMYHISVDSIGPDFMMVTYHGLVMENPDHTINLSALQTGRCLIKIRHCMRLVTATMDGGTKVAVTLDSVESPISESRTDSNSHPSTS
jgi:hypothetical protein